MPLCSTCNSIPFRALDRIIYADEKTKLASGLKNVVWFSLTGEEFNNDIEPESGYPRLWPWMKLKTVQQIYEEAPKCDLCQVITSAEHNV
jgi:hypothetical protein